MGCNRVSGIEGTSRSDGYKRQDLYLVNRLNNWEPGQVSGAELQVRDYDRLEEITYQIAADLDGMEDRYGEDYCVRNVEQLNPQIFAWLSILDVNIWVILILMAGVAGFTKMCIRDRRRADGRFHLPYVFKRRRHPAIITETGEDRASCNPYSGKGFHAGSS